MRKLAIAAALAVAPATASADLLGFGVGVGVDYWNAEPDGSTAYNGGDVDLQDDLKLDDSGEFQGWVYAEHPVPLIPNVRIERTSIASSGSNGEVPVATFGGFDVDATDVQTDLELDQTDFILYWSPLDNLFELDFGLDVKRVSGNLYLSGDAPGGGGSETLNEDLDGWIPLGYLAAGVHIPGTGLAVNARTARISAGDNSLTDTAADVSWTSAFGLGVRVGVRSQSLDLEDVGDVTVDTDFSGTYAGVHYIF
ncbi:outer membrane protein [Thiohalospira halophila DSM 15071]|uniref:Outer membrane protein n=1 Tax=Thiohalospira halophila DSM 15071 TaxID=1123397 RepID=A0A1I1TB76_9GAMM|nr:TIGR04219 family outer membrane beta-barrel protein [Thiohalospira halophila]SFD54378.1 outer membrane protein [Thiohalospira halophila DSM 15071]